MPEQKESNTQILTKSKLWKAVLIALATGVVGLFFGGVTWICTSLLALQKDMTETKAFLKERFAERPDDMALWEQVHGHEKQLRELEIKIGINEGLWKAVHGGRTKSFEPKDDPAKEPNEESELQKPEEDTRVFRERHLHPWVQRQAK